MLLRLTLPSPALPRYRAVAWRFHRPWSDARVQAAALCDPITHARTRRPPAHCPNTPLALPVCPRPDRLATHPSRPSDSPLAHHYIFLLTTTHLRTHVSSMPSPPKPWERAGAGGEAASTTATSTTTSAPATAAVSGSTPALPDRPSSLGTATSSYGGAMTPSNAMTNCESDRQERPYTHGIHVDTFCVHRQPMPLHTRPATAGWGRQHTEV